MTAAVMQPYLFPYIGYWQLISAVDIFVILDDVNYIKKGYVNRNSILINGAPKLFTLELIGASQNKLINEIEVGSNHQKILKTIETAYKKAPYFEKVFPVVQNVFGQEERNLAKFIGFSLGEMSKYLGLDTEFIYSSDIKKDNSLKAQDKILDICKKINATSYINAIGGKNLYDKAEFQERGIKLSFLETEMVEYRQFKNKFVPYLSTIDILMFTDNIKHMISRCALI